MNGGGKGGGGMWEEHRGLISYTQQGFWQNWSKMVDDGMDRCEAPGPGNERGIHVGRQQVEQLARLRGFQTVPTRLQQLCCAGRWSCTKNRTNCAEQPKKTAATSIKGSIKVWNYIQRLSLDLLFHKQTIWRQFHQHKLKFSISMYKRHLTIQEALLTVHVWLL